MAEDWKDKLSSLKSIFGNEDIEEKIEAETIEHGVEYGQKNPLTVVTDKKGRNGKIATIIEGFTIPQKDVEDIARQLKNKLGVGGSCREGEILIQGDHKNNVITFLKSKNFKTR